jgi:hypothetical protein
VVAAARGAVQQAEDRNASNFEPAEMDALGQRIVRAQHARQPLRQPLDDRNFQAEAAILDLPGKHRAFFQQSGEPSAEVVEAGAQLRRGGGRFQMLDSGAMPRQQVERQIDAVEIAVIGAAVLHMIDDLQRGAKRVVGGPGRARLAMHVEHEAADRHGRIAAVVHQLVEVAVAQLADVHAEGVEQILRVLRA